MKLTQIASKIFLKHIKPGDRVEILEDIFIGAFRKGMIFKVQEIEEQYSDGRPRIHIDGFKLLCDREEMLRFKKVENET